MFSNIQLFELMIFYYFGRENVSLGLRYTPEYHKFKCGIFLYLRIILQVSFGVVLSSSELKTQVS